MTITNEAKMLLENLFESNYEDCLLVKEEKSKNGTTLVFNLIKQTKSDKPTYINGIPVVMDKNVIGRSEKVTIAVNEGDLVINDPSAL